MDDQCRARLSLVLPGEEDPSEQAVCEKREGHRDYHGTLSGYCWETSNSDRALSLGDAEAEQLREMVVAWIDEGFTTPPYKAEVYGIIAKFGITVEDIPLSRYDLRPPE